MELFTLTQWIIVILVFLLGLFLGMAFLAGGKWKHRYRDEHRRVEELERENEALRRDAREMDSLRHSAARDRDRDLDRDGHRDRDLDVDRDRHRDRDRDKRGPL